MTEVAATRHAPRPCPYCGREIDALSGAGHGDAPNVGDWSLCFYCEEPLVLGLGLVPQKPDTATREKMLRDTTLETVRATLRRFNMVRS